MTTMMLVGQAPRRAKGAPSQVVAIRFYERSDGYERVLRLAKRQARDRHPGVPLAKVEWSIWEVRTSRGGWPKFVMEV